MIFSHIISQFVLFENPRKNMRPFIVIRSYEIADGVARKETIRKYVMSFAFEAFMSCIFREVRSAIVKF